MFRVLLLVVFVASGASAGGGSNCDFIKSVAPELYEEFLANITTRGENCSSHFQQLSVNSLVDLISKDDFKSAISSLSDSCIGSIYEYAGTITDEIAEFLGVSAAELSASQLGEEPVGEPYSCFQTYFVQGYNLVLATTAGLQSEVQALTDNYPE